MTADATQPVDRTSEGTRNPEKLEAALEDAIKEIADDDEPGLDRVAGQMKRLTDAHLALIGDDVTPEAIIEARIMFFQIAARYRPDFDAERSYTSVMERAFEQAANRPKHEETHVPGAAEGIAGDLQERLATVAMASTNGGVSPR